MIDVIPDFIEYLKKLYSEDKIKEIKDILRSFIDEEKLIEPMINDLDLKFKEIERRIDEILGILRRRFL